MQKLSLKSQGIIWAIFTCLLVSIMIAIVRHLSAEFHIFQIVMLRNFFALLVLLPLIIKKIDKVVKTKHLKLHFARSFVGLIAMFLWFYSIALIPLSEAVSISFIVPITTTLAAMIFLKEKVNKNIWWSLFVGLIGVLIILRPGFRDIGLPYLFAIFSPIIWTFSNILMKQMVKTEKPETITFYIAIIMFILSIPFALPYLKPVSFNALIWFIIFGLISNATYIANAICYTKVDISIIQPFDFSRLVFTIIIAYFVFDEAIDPLMIIGAIVILSASLLVIPRQSKISRLRKKVLKRRQKKLKILPTNI